jgi:hypothetical protein
MQTPLLIVQGSSEGNINTNTEYSNGTLSTIHPGVNIWYAWVNASGSQVIFLAFQSPVATAPVITFLGQHYYAQNGTEVFVGNTLGAMEVYNDTNGNGLPDANYTSGRSEILYDFIVNSSASTEIQPINRTTIQGLPHYRWGITYRTIDGFFTYPVVNESMRTNVRAMVMIDYMNFSYDYYVQGNVSYLKTNFGLGKITQITPYPGTSNLSLNGLSLALFYGTIVIASGPYATLVNGTPYNSTTATASVDPAETGEIQINATTAYKFLFGQNYTLSRDSTQETYRSNCTAVSDQSVPQGITNSERILSWMQGPLDSLFPNLQGSMQLDYNVSSFLYRVCYPVWSGYQLEHDPIYVAYLKISSVSELSSPLMFLIVAIVASTAALAMVLLNPRRAKKPSGSARAKKISDSWINSNWGKDTMQQSARNIVKPQVKEILSAK